MFRHDIPCVLITGGWDPPQDLLDASETFQVPVLRTPIATPVAISRIATLLDDALAVREIMHGVLMDILGLGVLIIGDSGIGKSECALDLIVRGHRLVADDTVEMRRRGESTLIGTCPELTRHHMEVRGLGVINIRDLFGIAATRVAKRVELVVRLERWDHEREYELLGIDENTIDVFGIKVPLICMPVAPGRNLAILVEVAARNQLLRSRGLNAARELAERPGEGPDGVAERLLRVFLSVWDDPDLQVPMIALARSLTDPSSRELMRDGFLEVVIGPLVSGLGIDEPERRMPLVASQVMGLVMMRYLLAVEPLASMAADELVATYAPTIQRYLTGPLPPAGGRE